MDSQQQIVWRTPEADAWGMVKTLAPREPEEKNRATLNIRLPGQYFDEETGLHDNWHRTYDPRTGRYLQPDPLGYPDGPDAYLYAQGDPVNKMDPAGLYEIDIHYYMTYFLAIMAGMPSKEARVVALSAQYIDDNPFTWPLNPNAVVSSYLTDPVGAAERLAAYHFTQSGFDPVQASNQNIVQYWQHRVDNPKNPQLNRLLAAANHNLQTSDNPKGMPPCTRAQLFGEYLHAFEDTFGHRNQNNEPIDVNAGLGHVLYGHETDYTFNDTVYLSPYPSAIGVWNARESRTLEMEKEAFGKIQSQFGTQALDKDKFPISFSDIQATLVAFNRISEKEAGGDIPDATTFKKKLGLLNGTLKKYGFNEIPQYSVTSACQNRQNYLRPIIALGSNAANDQYPGVILGTPN